VKNKVEGHNGLYKDELSGVIDNRESTERRRYRMAKQQALTNLESKDDINELKREIDEIKGLLHQLLNK
jgi:hypothetical protein